LHFHHLSSTVSVKFSREKRKRNFNFSSQGKSKFPVYASYSRRLFRDLIHVQIVFRYIDLHWKDCGDSEPHWSPEATATFVCDSSHNQKIFKILRSQFEPTDRRLRGRNHRRHIFTQSGCTPKYRRQKNLRLVGRGKHFFIRI